MSVFPIQRRWESLETLRLVLGVFDRRKDIGVGSKSRSVRPGGRSKVRPQRRAGIRCCDRGASSAGWPAGSPQQGGGGRETVPVS